ncbi:MULTISPECIES: hypothetical protein [Chryseobacterium]|uniref:Uncharacterized protein n=1 Tax=Chryseobacterium indoltheticum TaxID=254 RepID=A0A381FIK1_9FLAO|nr:MULTISPECIES: hypothetical protein [Chryseobacterium]OCK49651.1 hypothetical protein BA768_08665 [Chryseobacterium sp. CBo1]SHM73793.1 hypothetical protein SAMN05444360_116136 [Chryseobacterium carnipullorum]SUX46361.1 Uncharacterised protein [Chryseobacterium indoltheticum]
MTNKKILTLLFALFHMLYKACDACKLQQPEITKDLTHGTGPESEWDWLIVLIIVFITLVTLFHSVKFLIKPGEKDTNHIKNSVLHF